MYACVCSFASYCSLGVCAARLGVVSKKIRRNKANVVEHTFLAFVGTSYFDLYLMGFIFGFDGF